MRLEFHTLDVFTGTPFGGNPLAVVMDAEGLTSRVMQTMAREFNLSETVFVMPPADAANGARLRIFTPAKELPFAGHPTVGAAVLLAEMLHQEGDVFETTLRLEENVGLIEVWVRRLGTGPVYAEFTAARLPEACGEAPGEEAIAAALSLAAGDIGFGTHRPCLYTAGNAVLFVPLSSRAALTAARVDSAGWEGLGEAVSFGAYLYCAGDDEADYHARLYAPGAGVVEDPATGSAAAAMPGALLAAGAFGKGSNAVIIAQGEDMGRPSLIHLFADIEGGAVTRVRVGGQAVRISQGLMEVPE